MTTLYRLMKAAASRSMCRQRSLAHRERRLAELGYSSFAAYVHSNVWNDKMGEYDESPLLKRCMICGKSPFILQHTSYKFLSQENPMELLPLCLQHYKSLYELLAAHNLPYEFSEEALRLLLPCSDKQFNMRVSPYHKSLIAWAAWEYRCFLRFIGRKGDLRKVIWFDRNKHRMTYEYDPRNGTVSGYGTTVSARKFAKSFVWRQDMATNLREYDVLGHVHYPKYVLKQLRGQDASRRIRMSDRRSLGAKQGTLFEERSGSSGLHLWRNGQVDH